MENIEKKHNLSDELKSIEIEAKTPEEAIEKALVVLKTDREQVKIKILSEEERGLFGMAGAHLAKVRVTVCKKKRKD